MQPADPIHRVVLDGGRLARRSRRGAWWVGSEVGARCAIPRHRTRGATQGHHAVTPPVICGSVASLPTDVIWTWDRETCAIPLAASTTLGCSTFQISQGQGIIKTFGGK